MRRFLIRLGIALGALVLVVVALGGLAIWAMTLHFNPSPPAKDFPKPKTALEAQRQDLEYFSKLLAMDRSFSPATREAANRRIAALEKLPEALPHQRFRVALMEIAALADNGHTGVFGGQTNAERVPVHVFPFADGLYVLRAKDAALAGGQVLAVDGVPVADVMATIMALRGGTEAERRYLGSYYVTVQDDLYGTGISVDPHA